MGRASRGLVQPSLQRKRPSHVKHLYSLDLFSSGSCLYTDTVGLDSAIHVSDTEIFDVTIQHLHTVTQVALFNFIFYWSGGNLVILTLQKHLQTLFCAISFGEVCIPAFECSDF